MNLLTMKFGEFIFPNNPSELVVKNTNNIKETVIPFSGSRTSNLGRLKRKISGKGYFIGEDSFEQFAALQKQFEKGAASLQLPGQTAFAAIMDSLVLTDIDSDGAVEYSFEFTEVLSQESKISVKSLVASGGESLWDYAYSEGLSVETLTTLNTHIRDIGNLDEGERVNLS